MRISPGAGIRILPAASTGQADPVGLDKPRVCHCDEESLLNPTEWLGPVEAAGVYSHAKSEATSDKRTCTPMKKTALLIVSASLLLGLAHAPAQNPPAPPHDAKAPTAKHVRNVGVEEFDKLRAQTNAVVLDVRTKREFDAGHIPGAANLDINAPDFQAKAAKLDKSKTYLVHCAAGGRSARACNAMDKLSFTNLVNLAPGFNAWKKAGKPITTK